MGLFDIFKPKTVEVRYSTLLKLFKRIHRTFTITRNEKCVIEFTFGIDNENKQYWSIEQPFDVDEIHVENGYSYNPSKRVTIAVHTTVDGYPVKTKSTFNQAVNQTVMFNTIIQMFTTECAKALDDLYGKEVREEIKKEKELEQIQNNKKQKEINSSNIENIKENRTKEISNKSTSTEVLNDSVSIYDKNLEWEINVLTPKQKFTFLALICVICNEHNIPRNRTSVNAILKDLTNMLGFNSTILDMALLYQSNEDIIQYIKEIKNVKMDGPFIRFLYICETLVHLAYYSNDFINAITQVLIRLEFTKKEIEGFLKGIENYQSIYYYKYRKDDIHSSSSWDDIEKWGLEVTSLSVNQKTSLLKLAILLVQPLDEESNITDKEYKELQTFTFVLDFNEEVLTEILSKVSIIDKKTEINIARTIHVEGPFQFFVSTCNNLWKLTDMDYYFCSKYVNMLESLGFTIDNINKILHKEKFCNLVNNYVNVHDYFIKEWSLLDFAREYGKPKLAHCKNQDTEEEFTCVVFRETSDRIFVAFSPIIGELSPQEIAERKNQLKVAKWVKGDKEGYTLYE